MQNNNTQDKIITLTIPDPERRSIFSNIGYMRIALTDMDHVGNFFADLDKKNVLAEMFKVSIYDMKHEIGLLMHRAKVLRAIRGRSY